MRISRVVLCIVVPIAVLLITGVWHTLSALEVETTVAARSDEPLRRDRQQQRPHTGVVQNTTLLQFPVEARLSDTQQGPSTTRGATAGDSGPAQPSTTDKVPPLARRQKTDTSNGRHPRKDSAQVPLVPLADGGDPLTPSIPTKRNPDDGDSPPPSVITGGDSSPTSTGTNRRADRNTVKPTSTGRDTRKEASPQGSIGHNSSPPPAPPSLKYMGEFSTEENTVLQAQGSGSGASAVTHAPPLVTREAYEAVDWLADGPMPAFTKEMQALIYQHQNPMSCVGKKFIVWGYLNSGLGNDLHTLSWAFANALNQNRIILAERSYTGKPWKYAGDVVPSSLDHYYAPITNCSREMIWKSHPYRGLNYPGQGRGFSSGDEGLKGWRHMGKTWWRVQCMRYLLRTRLPWWDKHLKKLIAESGLPDPLPPNVLSIHVRMSDKAKEMKLKSLTWYMHEAEKLKRLNPNMSTIFISSEDGLVMRATTKFPQWKFLSVPEDRENLNHQKFIGKFGSQRLMEISMLNLHFHQQCDYYIAARLSNWCRLIDECRQSAGKIHRPFVWILGTAALGQL
eukprot:NODE_151_length_2101_cov_53.054205_g127_i0.p1 GENE.NODE_151_length_2101_cov_53.054205_g127_i0~~NODE_151_length_2101_cov_53.054205_g127_i0.p1  ORF type:complete len:565 (+),score=63.46 NODE_151_length_2101_cov_53.054205_g127_i0:93-1787(+)